MRLVVKYILFTIFGGLVTSGVVYFIFCTLMNICFSWWYFYVAGVFAMMGSLTPFYWKDLKKGREKKEEEQEFAL